MPGRGTPGRLSDDISLALVSPKNHKENPLAQLLLQQTAGEMIAMIQHRLAFVFVTSVLGCSLLTANAEAASGVLKGYVCSSSHSPARPTTPATNFFGSGGHLIVNVSTGPACTGTVSADVFICSKGATSTICDLNSLYSEPALLSLAQNLQRASSTANTVELSYSNFNAWYAGSTVKFRAD